MIFFFLLGHPAVFSLITGRNHPFAVKWPAGLEILLSGHRSFCPPLLKPSTEEAVNPKLV